MKNHLTFAYVKQLLMAITFTTALIACKPLPVGVLLAGSPEVDDLKVDQFPPAQDGTGLVARFGLIQDLDVDAQGNVYVLERSPDFEYSSESLDTDALIRKISSDGQVTTLVGQRSAQLKGMIDSSPIISYQSMEVVDNTLYFSKPGCLMKVDLTQQPLVAKLFVGQCLDMAMIESLVAQGNRMSRTITTTFLMGDRFHSLYVLGNLSGKDDQGRGEFNIVRANGEVRNIENTVSTSYSGVDSQGNFYMVQPGYPGPGTPSPGTIRKYDVYRNYIPFVGQFQIRQPGYVALDHQDRLYITEGADNTLKRLNPDGKLETLSSLKDAKGNYLIVRQIAVPPQDSVIYVADETAVYKITLPQPSDSGARR